MKVCAEGVLAAYAEFLSTEDHTEYTAAVCDLSDAIDQMYRDSGELDLWFSNSAHDLAVEILQPQLAARAKELLLWAAERVE